MEMREFGASDLEVSRIGLGLAALGRPGYINLGHAGDLERDYVVEHMERRAHEVLDAAWLAGIRYYDAARSYGRAEQFLSTWLSSRDIVPGTIAVGSKWGYTYTAGWQISAERHEIKEHTEPVLNRQIGESRSLLGAHLDLYQIHSATLDSGVLENQEVFSKLASLREQGLQIGFSTSGPLQSETIKRAMDVRLDGRPLFTAVQATWNLLAQEAGDILRQAHESGMGVIVKEALANGRLTDRNKDSDFYKKYQQLEQLAQSSGIPMDAYALAAALAQPWADVVLSGAASIDQLRSNIKALELDLRGEVQELSDAFVEDAGAYWQARSELAWN